VCAKLDLLKQFKPIPPVQSPRKIFRFAAPPKTRIFINFGISEIQLDGEVETGIDRIIPPPQKGRFAIVTDVRRDAVDADGA
jgi:hypothetical protein